MFTAPIRATKLEQLLELLCCLDVYAPLWLNPSQRRHQQLVGGRRRRDRRRRVCWWRHLGEDVPNEVRQNHLHEARPAGGKEFNHSILSPNFCFVSDSFITKLYHWL